MERDLLEYAKNNDLLVKKSKTFKRIADRYNLHEKRVLDIGCGAGSHMQRFGADSVGITTRTDEVELGKKIKRDIRLGNVEVLNESLPTSEQFDVIWCNNIFEHLLSPHAFLVKLKEFSKPETVIILGTPMVPIAPSLMKIRKFSGALATAHVNFFNYKTYQLTVEFTGWKTKELSPYYFSNQHLNSLAVSFAPHLYLVAKNNPDYRYDHKKIIEWEQDPLYKPLIKVMNPDHL